MTLIQSKQPRAIEVEITAGGDFFVGGADLTVANGYRVSSSTPWRWRLAANEDLYAMNDVSAGEVMLAVISN